VANETSPCHPLPRPCHENFYWDFMILGYNKTWDIAH
jgi:hypothetical protein